MMIYFNVPVKVLVNVTILIGAVALIYYTFVTTDDISHSYLRNKNEKIKFISNLNVKNMAFKDKDHNVWLIFTKVSERSPLKYKFVNLIGNLLNVSSISLSFNIIVDNSSAVIAINELSDMSFKLNKTINYTMYDIKKAAHHIDDIVSVMTPYFSSTPGTYYSDALFYISLGLHRIAPAYQEQAIMLDCDLYFKQDIALLFEEFDHFKSTALFGLAPELTPVYRHILRMYKAKHNTTFGEYYHMKNISNEQHPKGFQGYNSGVILLNLSAIRESKEYVQILKRKTVGNLVMKYQFRGHLGDQDFYTLIGFEYPHLIQTLKCGFNRQLCVWWRDRGYKNVFDFYFNCKHPTVVLHGNCNTKIPK